MLFRSGGAQVFDAAVGAGADKCVIDFDVGQRHAGGEAHVFHRLLELGALFVGGWVLQFLGHHYEGKRPALLDNIFQGFIGPMFLVAETMVALGYRADLADVMGEGEVRP